MADNLNQRILTLLGKLALAQALALNSRMELATLIDNYDLKRVKYDDDTITRLNRAVNDLKHSEFTIGDAIYDITSVEFFQESTVQDR